MVGRVILTSLFYEDPPTLLTSFFSQILSPPPPPPPLRVTQFLEGPTAPPSLLKGGGSDYVTLQNTLRDRL